MIQPLRAVHRAASVALAFVIPATLIVGLVSRRPSMVRRTPAASLPASLRLLRPSVARWQKLPLETSLYGDLNRPNDFSVVLRPSSAINEPALLIYWTKSQVDAAQLPADAQLLGPFAPGRVMKLPPQFEPGSRLIAYSLGHQVVVDWATLESLP
jgi:hypothetical protein